RAGRARLPAVRTVPEVNGESDFPFTGRPTLEDRPPPGATAMRQPYLPGTDDPGTALCADRSRGPSANGPGAVHRPPAGFARPAAGTAEVPSARRSDAPPSVAAPSPSRSPKPLPPPSDRDDDLADLLVRLQVAVRLNDLVERERPGDEGLEAAV